MVDDSPHHVNELLPDITQLMSQIGGRFWILYYAAEAGNWDLAQYQLTCTRNLFQKATTVATEALTAKLQRFVDDYLDPVEDAIESRDWGAFQSAYEAAVNSANAYHRDIGVSFIEWTLPSEPPSHLNLNAPS